MVVFQVSLNLIQRKNTEINTMSQFIFSESDIYSEKNTCDNKVFCSTILHHRKKLNKFTIPVPICYRQEISIGANVHIGKRKREK